MLYVYRDTRKMSFGPALAFLEWSYGLFHLFSRPIPRIQANPSWRGKFLFECEASSITEADAMFVAATGESAGQWWCACHVFERMPEPNSDVWQPLGFLKGIQVLA